MSDKESKELPKMPGDFLHVAEQAEGAALALANLLSVYHRELLTKGIHPDLADTLTVEYQRLLLGTIGTMRKTDE